MKKITFLLASFFLFCTTVFAAPIDRIIFFGDSLSDNGNLYKLLLKIVPKSPPYFQGRFSNGPTWAENVGKFYYDKYYIDYKIYAYGGATAIFHMPSTQFATLATLELEIDRYLIDSLFTDKSKTLYAIWIGSNDYLFDQQTNVSKVINKITWSMQTLINRGARNFLILNLPDLSHIPFAQSTGAIDKLHDLSVQHNQLLLEMVNNIKAKYPKVKINFINMYDLFNDVMADPEKYNQKYNIHITNTTQGCWQGGYLFKNGNLQQGYQEELQQTLSNKSLNKNTDIQLMSNFILNSPSIGHAYAVGRLYDKGGVPCSNADEYLFWDQMHPTELVHRVLSDIVIDNLNQQIK